MSASMFDFLIDGTAFIFFAITILLRSLATDLPYLGVGNVGLIDTLEGVAPERTPPERVTPEVPPVLIVGRGRAPVPPDIVGVLG